jgi:hypothetical protein
MIRSSDTLTSIIVLGIIAMLGQHYLHYVDVSVAIGSKANPVDVHDRPDRLGVSTRS